MGEIAKQMDILEEEFHQEIPLLGFLGEVNQNHKEILNSITHNYSNYSELDDVLHHLQIHKITHALLPASNSITGINSKIIHAIMINDLRVMNIYSVREENVLLSKGNSDITKIYAPMYIIKQYSEYIDSRGFEIIPTSSLEEAIKIVKNCNRSDIATIATPKVGELNELIIRRAGISNIGENITRYYLVRIQK